MNQINFFAWHVWAVRIAGPAVISLKVNGTYELMTVGYAGRTSCSATSALSGFGASVRGAGRSCWLVGMVHEDLGCEARTQ